jgi:hypothetical protein
MFRNMRRRRRAARERRFTEQVASYLRTHFGEVLGSDDAVLDREDAIELLHRKYFG